MYVRVWLNVWHVPPVQTYQDKKSTNGRCNATCVYNERLQFILTDFKLPKKYWQKIVEKKTKTETEIEIM